MQIDYPSFFENQDLRRAPFYEARRSAIEKFTDNWLNKDKQILDFGCGNGDFLNLLPELKKQTFCVDSNHSCCNLANKKLSSTDYNPHIVQNDILLPFADNAFSSVISFNCLDFNNITQPHLLELKRVLTPDGSLVHIRDMSLGFEYLFAFLSKHHLFGFNPEEDLLLPNFRSSINPITLAETLDVKTPGIMIVNSKALKKFLSKNYRNLSNDARQTIVSLTSNGNNLQILNALFKESLFNNERRLVNDFSQLCKEAYQALFANQKTFNLNIRQLTENQISEAVLKKKMQTAGFRLVRAEVLQGSCAAEALSIPQIPSSDVNLVDYSFGRISSSFERFGSQNPKQVKARYKANAMVFKQNL